MNNESGNNDTRLRRASHFLTGLIIVLVVLLISGAMWLFLGGSTDGRSESKTETANQGSQVPDTAAVKSQAVAAAKAMESALPARSAGDVLVTSDSATGSISTIRAGIGGDLFPEVPADRPPATKVAAFLAEHGGLLGIDDPARQLKLMGVEKDQYGHSHVSYQQMHGGVPVLGAVLKGHVSPDGRLTAVNGKFIPGVDVPTKAIVGRDEANQWAIARVGQQQPSAFKEVPLSVKTAKLVVYRTNLTRGAAGQNLLAYEVQVVGNQVREFVYIDALTGKVVDQITGIHGSKHRRVHEVSILTPPTWEEGDMRPTPHPAQEDEIVGTGQTYNLFYNLSGGRDSWDGAGATMVTVNNDPTIVCPNANWNGTSTNYCSGTSADDVVAHEWTHAYTQEVSGLIYSYQSGAANEAFSDIFGETVDILNNRDQIGGATPVTGNNELRSKDDTICSEFMSELPQDDDSVRWLVGEDAFAFTPLPPVGDAAIRDMWRPRCSGGELFLGNPGHGSSHLYHCDASDAGGVHVNSNIMNRAYALLVDGDKVELKDDGTPFANQITVTGIGLTKAAHIFWRANEHYNGPASNFNDNADSLLMACNDLIGINLRKLVTTPEIGTGFLGANNDTVIPTPELSGEAITAADCQQVENAIAAVELRHDVAAQCGFVAPLDPAPAPMCGGGTVERQLLVDWESGIPAGWTVGQTPLTKSQLDTRPWFLRNNLPKGKLGQAMYQENRVDLGNCSSDDESGVLYMISPEITVAADGPGFLAFEHYFLTESGYDGGNLMISINGGIFQPIPQLAYSVVPGTGFVHNPYNGNLNDIQNTNPKFGQEAFNGANPLSGDNNWGQSQVDLAAAGVAAGDTIRLRWDFGQDGCNGNDGWYVDKIEVFTCGAGAPPPPPAQQCEIYPADTSIPSSLILNVVGSTTTATVSGATNPVTDVNIRDLTGTHSYMGDLNFKLQSPAGTEITLFDGANCTGEDGIDIEFDDRAARQVSCTDWQSGGSFRPFKALAVFNDENANGDWTLSVTDSFLMDDGQIDSWTLELCRDLPCAGEKATGGGWLAANGNGKVNFGLKVEQTTTGPSGSMQLSDKGAGVKIQMTTVMSIGAVQGECGAITENAHAIEIRGSGIFGKNTAATFRACVEDNGNGKKNGGGLADRFHLECTSGCNYSTASRVLDDKVDSGNTDVLRKCSGTAVVQPGQPSGGTSVLILNPVMMTEGLLGTTQLFEVGVFGSDQEPLASQNVSLTRVSANGATQTLNTVADATGKAIFSVSIATQASEYEATSNDVGSNAVHVTPVTALP